MSSDAYSWGQRTVADVDYMNDQMQQNRLGCDLPPSDNAGGVEDDWPNSFNMGMGSGYMGNKDLEQFRAHDDDGTKVTPMHENQAAYAGYGDVKYGYQRKK